MKINNLLGLVAAVGVSELAGVVGSVFTISAIPTWYAGLAKPELNPPSWVFGPTWTMLYALMGVAAFLVWRAGWGKREVKLALGIFGLQLALNAIWSIIFFGLQSPGWALAEIAFLWVAIFATIIVFSRVSRPAAGLLVPYILWVSFAGYLNFMIWRLN
ncbi:MAG: tryptophan-rich sensory protein [Candidatus Nealsonbacteria bacterium]|nr:tryptophan-rich sensory protein [Candidatus Nealsonbacteria bacterium]